MSPDSAWSHMLGSFRIDDDTTPEYLLHRRKHRRKHRKLLKDGSGKEVWPGDLESVFIQGLRKYLESSCMISESRGRNQSRNQFMVDYLKINGVERTKSQVASHIQVLRNMWKGEPELYLVAGCGEHKNLKLNIEGPNQVFSDIDIAVHSSNADQIGVPYNTSSTISSVGATNIDGPSQPFTPYMTNYYPANPPDLASANGISQWSTTSQITAINQLPMSPILKALVFIVDGTDPYWISLDDLTAFGHLAPFTPLTLNIKLSMSHLASSTTPSIAAYLYFSSLTYDAKCSTEVLVNGQIEMAEQVALTLATPGGGYLIAELFGSQLNRFPSLEPSLSSAVTQEITAGDQTLLFLIYEFDCTTYPISPQLLDFRKFHYSDKAVAVRMSLPSSHSDKLVSHQDSCLRK